MNKKEAKSHETKERLCSAFLELYKNKPIERISIKEITDAAGCNRATFYIHYIDIYDILAQIEKKILDNAKSSALDFAKEIISGTNISFDFVKVLAGIYYENEKGFPVLMTRDLNFVNSIKKIIKEEIITKQNELQLLSTDETDYIIEYQLSAIMGVLNMWMQKEKNIPFEDLSALMFQISTTGAITTIRAKISGS